jgi:hypothetical protein
LGNQELFPSIDDKGSKNSLQNIQILSRRGFANLESFQRNRHQTARFEWELSHHLQISGRRPCFFGESFSESFKKGCATEYSFVEETGDRLG